MPKVRLPLEIPATKSGCQTLLRNLGHTGYRIDSIDQESRKIFVLSAPVYQGAITDPDTGEDEGVWRRTAHTFTFFEEGDEVRVTQDDGWKV